MRTAFWLLASWLWAAVATGQAPPSPSPQAAPAAAAPASATSPAAIHGVAYGSVDQATVRVYAVHGTQPLRVRGRKGVRLLGVPQAGHGSGVIVSEDGLILTAHHVAENARLLAVRLPGEGGLYPARVVVSDAEADWAVLAVQGRFSHFVPLPEQLPPMRVRSTLDALGYPLDSTRRHPQSSRGILSGVLNDGSLQLAMSLNPGNSGGPLIDDQERLVGLVVARGDPSQGVQGVGVAVPHAELKRALRQARDPQALTRAREFLSTYAVWGTRAAQVVELMVTSGVLGGMVEALSEVEDSAGQSVLRRLDALAIQLRDPQLMALAAAVFWDAGEIVLEQADGAFDPRRLPQGPTRAKAQALRDRAVYLCHVAAGRDPGIYQRSPFVAEVVRLFPEPPAWPRAPL